MPRSPSSDWLIWSHGRVQSRTRACISRVGAASTPLNEAKAKAKADKYRNGVYHSGDLGHVLKCDGVRFLYFDGRADDWIRKDGKNFSALQVARFLQEHPDVVLAAAYGIP